MRPIEILEQLESRGEVRDADEPGTYALRVSVPNSVDDVQRAWMTVYREALSDEKAEQLAAADTVLYVGETSRPIRERLVEHVEGEKWRASLLKVFEIEGVAGVWAGDTSVTAEGDRARSLSDETTCVWCDGDLF